MQSVEEVMIPDSNTEYEVEYITEEMEDYETSDPNVPATPVVAPTKPEKTTDETPPTKRKVPIIRKPGEVVTPVRRLTTGTVKVSPLTAFLSSQRVQAARGKVERPKVEPPPMSNGLPKVPQTPVTRVITDEGTIISTEFKDVGQEYEVFDHQYAEAAVTDAQGPQPQVLDRIEKKMDMILAKLDQHDAALQAIKISIRDLRTELRNSVNDLKGVPTGGTVKAKSMVPTPPKRKRLICFPVADDNYLLRLDELLQVDDQIRDEVTMLFKEAPSSSAYEFMRKNVYALFEKCSKYTWTGKPSNAMPSMAPANVASKLALVDHLITCACETFPHLSREIIAKDFRRALTNFNDIAAAKRKKPAETNKPLNNSSTTPTAVVELS